MNPARQFLNILAKDVRGHLPEIGIVLVLNVVLAVTATQSWTEGLDWTLGPDPSGTQIDFPVQVLLILAWCVLIGRVVHEDGVTGKVPYWLTRPCSRRVLLASKLGFVLLFVHLPLFLNHFFIVTGSGLPLSFTQILADQAVLGAVVSLPVMALATLTTNFVRFVFVGVAIAAVALFVAETPIRISYAFGVMSQAAGSTFFVATGSAILAAIAGVALVCQYRWRATLLVAVSSFVALCVLSLGMLVLSSFVMRAMGILPRPETVASTIRLGDPPGRLLYEDPSDMTEPLRVILPIELTVADDAQIIHTELDVLSAENPMIEHIYDTIAAVRRTASDGTWWLHLRMSQAEYDSLKDGLVSIRLIVDIATYETRELEPIPLDGAVALVGGRAQCGIRGPRATIACRTSFGWSMWDYGSPNRQTYQFSLPLRLRFAINPILVDTTGGSEVSSSVRRRVSYTRQEVTFEGIRLGDWEP